MLKPPGVSQTVFIFGALLVSFIVWVASRGELGIYLGFFGFGGGSVQGNTQTTQDLLKAQGGSTGILDTIKNWWSNPTTPSPPPTAPPVNNPLLGGLGGVDTGGGLAGVTKQPTPWTWATDPSNPANKSLTGPSH